MKNTLLYAGALLLALNLVYNIREFEETKRINRILQENKWCDGIADNGNISVDEEQVADAQQAQMSLKSGRPTNKLAEILKSGDTGNIASDYGVPLFLQTSAIFLVMMVFSILGLLCYYCCCCCDKCCPPLKCCRRKKPMGTIESSIYSLLILGLCGVVCILAFVAIAYNAKFATGQNYTKCAMTAALKSFNRGQVQDTFTWVGISPFAGKIVTLMAQVSSAATTIANTFAGSDEQWLTPSDSGSVQAIQRSVDSMYSEFQNMQVKNPALSGSPVDVTPKFIESLWGPTTSTETFCGVLTTEFKVKGDIVSGVFNGIKDSSTTVNAQSAAINTAMQGAQTPVNALRDQLTTSETSFDDMLEATEPLTGLLQQGFDAMLAIMALSCCISIVGIVMAKMCSSFKKLSIIMHLSWCLVCIIMIFAFLFSAILSPISVVLLEFCEVFNEIKSTQIGMNAYRSMLSETVVDNMGFCMFDSGDLAVKFAIRDQLQVINEVTSQFDKLASIQDPNSPNYINIGGGATSITTLNNQLDGIISGKTPIATPAEETEQNQLYALGVMQGKINNLCTNSQDEFRYDSTDCTAAVWNSAGGATSSYGSPVCIQISSISVADFNTRYNSGVDCAEKVDIMARFLKLHTFDADKTTKFTNIKDNKLAPISTQNTNYMTNFQNYITKVLNLKNVIIDLLDEVSDPKVGLLAGLNCKFLKTALDNFYNAFCVAMVVPLSTLIGLIGAASFFMFFVSYFIFQQGLRIGRKDPVKKDEEGAKKQQYEMPNQQFQQQRYE